MPEISHLRVGKYSDSNEKEKTMSADKYYDDHITGITSEHLQPVSSLLKRLIRQMMSPLSKDETGRICSFVIPVIL